MKLIDLAILGAGAYWLLRMSRKGSDTPNSGGGDMPAPSDPTGNAQSMFERLLGNLSGLFDKGGDDGMPEPPEVGEIVPPEPLNIPGAESDILP